MPDPKSAGSVKGSAAAPNAAKKGATGGKNAPGNKNDPNNGPQPVVELTEAQQIQLLIEDKATEVIIHLSRRRRRYNL